MQTDYKTYQRIFYSLFMLLSLVFIAWACQTSGESYKPRSLGAPGEVLLVIDNVNWNSKAGRVLADKMTDIFPALPQAEYLFKKTRIEFSDFQRHFRTYRNILLVSVKPAELINRVEYHKDQWAVIQQVAEVIVKDQNDLEVVLNQKWPFIKTFFYNGDIDALAQSYRRVFEAEAVTYVKNNYPFSLYFPKGFELKKKADGFTWLANERLDSHLGVFIYQFPLDSLEAGDARSLLRLRNRILQEQVPGEYPGSFMTTEDSFPVIVNKSKFAGRKWTELRGLWKVQGDFMGGPFVDYFFADHENKMMIMLEGYVYAPSRPEKGILVREVEAVLKSFMPV